MKNLIPTFLLLISLASCVSNQETGQMETGWLFWVFLGLLLGGLFCGAIYNLLRKKKPDNAPTKAEEEIEAYEETLEKKLKEEEDKENKENK